MVQKILNVKDPVLRLQAKKVRKIDKKILRIIEDMKDTLAAQDDPEGVGLAAPQIGRSYRIFLMKYKKLSDIIINPEVISRVKPPQPVKNVEPNKPLEGCLSLPHYYGPISRTNKIKIKYIDESGTVQVKEFRGFPAQIVEHEIDHLNGILFIDRIVEQGTPLFHYTKGEWEEVELI
jgi:peptide deformylase